MRRRQAALVGAVSVLMLVPGCGSDADDASKPPNEQQRKDLIVETEKPSTAAQEQALEQEKSNPKADEPVARDKDTAPDSRKSSEMAADDEASKWSPRNEPGLTVSERDVYEEAKIVCDIKSPRAIAKDYHLNTSDPDRIATRYARGYVDGLKQPAYEGCIEALIN